MIDRHELAIVRTVIYAALFEYPLTLDQLHRTLISAALPPDDILSTYHGSARLRSIVEYRDGFFFPAGCSRLIDERRQRESRSREFLRRHRRVLQLICTLPFTRMVALSGSIAHLNLEDGGDLDLFVVTRGRRVWTVTVAMILLTRLLGVRRIVCANFVMSDERLTIDQQDLFTANQVIHLKPLIGREVFEGFVAANAFVQRFYPNRAPQRRDELDEFELPQSRARTFLKGAFERMVAIPSPAIEAACRWLYARHLRRRSSAWRSPEQVKLQPDSLKLHTQSHRRSVLERFDERVDEALGRRERAAIA